LFWYLDDVPGEERIMEFIPSMKADRSSIGVQRSDRASTLYEERLISLSSWMVILGTIRVICTFVDLVSAFLNAYKLEPLSVRMLSNFVEANQPFLALGVLWPLFLGIVVRRTRWPELLTAAGVSFLILSISGLLESTAELNYANADGVTFGSFHLRRLAFRNPTLSDVTLGLLGASQLVLEFATALCCLWLSHVLHKSRARALESSKQEGARRARLGRLAAYASVGFLVLIIRLPVWSTYVEIINDSRIVREFVLKNDFGRTNRPRRGGNRLSKEAQRMMEFQRLLAAALAATNTEDFLEAKETYLEIISRAEPSAENPTPPSGYQPIVSQAQNNVAWLLATCPKTEIRDAAQAVKHARIAVEIEPQTGNYWNTLGVALYRNGNWNEAKNALSRSIELRGNGDSFDWFFLAIIHLKQGRKEQALDLYGKAVRWYQESAPDDGELYRFQIEAARELGLPKPAPRPSLQPGKSPWPTRNPTGIR
jgi:tetratricopeptide (TPR) repeat protein